MTEAGRITAIIDGDISALTSKLAQAKSQAVSSVSGIESEMRGKVGAGISGALSGGDYSKAGKQIGGSLIDGITSSFGPLGGAAGEIATALGPTGIVATAAVAGAAIIASSASSAAMEWEAGMSQISKTTGIAKGSEGFEDLSGQLKDLTATMPTTVGEIQGVASAAGSLGIAQQYIAGFTQVALQMGSAFDIPAEQASVSVGKILGQTKAIPDALKNSLGQVDASAFAQHFGSAVDFVGNSLNATEADVLDFATRVQGSLSGLGANVYETAGWGGVLSSVFPSAERAAGSFDSLLTQLTTNTDSQTAASNLLGVSVEDFMQSMTTDPSSTLLNIGKALEGLPSDKLMEVSKQLGGAYGMDVLTKMVGHTDEWKDSIDRTVEAGQKGESIGQSFAAGADTADAQIQVLKNSVGMMLTDIGGPLNSAIAPLIGALAGSFNSVRKIGENLWGPFTAAISPATTAVSLLASGVGGLMGMQLDGLVAASEAINTGFEIGSTFVGAFVEELEKVVTGSSAFQALSSAAQGFYTTLSGIGTGISDIVGKITSGLGEAIPTALSGAGQAVGSLLDQAGLGGISDTAGEVNSFLGAVYDNAAEKLGWGVEDGTKKGMEAGSEAAKGKVGDAVEEAVTVGVNDGFDKAKDALKKAGISDELAGYMAAFGMSDADALAAINRQSNQVKDTVIDTNVALQGQEYIIRNIATTQGSYYKLLSSSGAYIGGTGLMNVGALNSFNPTNWALSLLPKQSAILDSYLTFSKNIEGEIHDAGKYISQTYLDGMNFDTATIADSIYNLKMLEFYDPEEAKAQGVDAATDYMTSLIQAVSEYDAAKAEYIAEPNDAEMKAKFEASLAKLDGIAKANPLKLKVDMDSVEVDFEVWLQEHGDLFVAQWENTKVMPIREQQFQRQQWELEAEKSNPNALKYLQLIDKAITSDEPGMVSGLYVYTAALLNAAPEIANTAWLTQELGSAQSELSQHVVNVNGTWIALDENGKKLGETYLDTTIAAKGANGGLIELQAKAIATANAMAEAARAAGSLDSVFGNYALSLRSNATQSAQYDYLGSGGRTSWNNVFGNYTSQFSLPKFAEGAHVTGPTVALVGESGPETVIPDKYLQSGGYSTGFYPATQKTPAANYWNALYDNSGTCVAFAEPDPSLKFTPPGSVPSTNYVGVYNANGDPVAFAEVSGQTFSGVASGISASKTVSIDSSPSGALVTGLSKNGYVVSYDPRTDTCDGIPFNAPDPSLKTTDPFYLGLTKNSPAYKSVEEDGWGGAVAQALTPELAAMQEQYQQQIQESQRTAQATQQTATNTRDVVSGINSLGSAISGALVSSGSGYGNGYTYTTDNGVWGSGSRYGSFFGDSWISGGAAGVGAGWDREPSWGGEAASAWTRSQGGYTSGSGSFTAGNGGYQLPAIFRARGGLIDKGPELAIVGEAGTEMILPPHVTQAVLDMTARGGGAAPNITVNYAPVIQGAGLSAEELAAVLEKDRAALIVEIAEASRGF